MDEKIQELIEALKPITEQDPEIMDRGQAIRFVRIEAIPLIQFRRLIEAARAVEIDHG